MTKKRVKFVLVAVVALTCAQVATAGPTFDLDAKSASPLELTLEPGTYVIEAFAGKFTAWNRWGSTVVWDNEKNGYTQGWEMSVKLTGDGIADTWLFQDQPAPYTPNFYATPQDALANARVETIVIPEPGTVKFSFVINDNIYTDNAGGVSFQVCRIPAPGAMLLGSLGAGLVGFWRRRRAF